VNTKDNKFGATPLHKASCCGHVHVVQEFLEHSADSEAKTASGWTPLHFACDTGHVAVVIELLSPSDSNGATTSILGKRKSRGANIEANHAGDTPLHGASREVYLAIVKALLSGGVDILAANNDGRLPIHLAVICRKSAVAKYLLQHFYATTCRLPLHKLLEDLPWIDSPFSSSVPPLRFALALNVLGTDDVVEIVAFLVGRNSELISACDQDDSLPLHVACRGVSFPIVQSLVNL
jgi:ankyrin repeat protein